MTATQPGAGTPTTRRNRFGMPAASNRSPRRKRQLTIVAAVATVLASAPLSAIFETWTWLFDTAVAVAFVAGAAMIARSLRVAPWLQFLAMLAALLMALTWMFRSGDEFFGLLPTASTFRHFGVLLSELPADVRGHAIPVPDLDSLHFIVALGVGLVAVLIDMCTVELRRPALAGLPMLAVYSVPVAVMLGDVPAYTFAIGVVGYLWLLGADNLDRVRRFGRRFTGDGRDVDVWEPSPLAAAGRRLAMIGVAVAVVLPLLVPGVSTSLIDRLGPGFSNTSGEGSGTGSVNLFASLNGLLNRDEIVELMEVDTGDPAPHYLRIGVADVIGPEGFDHRRPRGRPVDEGLERALPRAGVELQRYRTDIEILSEYEQARLPTYPQVEGVTGLDDDWRYDPVQQVIFGGGSSAGESYTFNHARPVYDPDALRGAPRLPEHNDLQRYAEIPESLQEPEVTELVAELTDGIDNPYDQVRAILAYFNTENGFRYSLETGNETTGSAIVDFLIVNQRGYCVQYATAMAWMVRELGLPSRVAIGFTSGGQRTEGSFTLTNHNAHAWPEIYFSGFGWVPFEPTPSSSIRGSVTPEWAPDPNGSDDPDQATPGPQDPAATAGPLDSPDQDRIPEGGVPGGAAGADGEGRSQLRALLAGGAALLVALLAAPALSRFRLRRIRFGRTRAPAAARGRAHTPASTEATPGVMTVADPVPEMRARAHAAWDELLDTMVDFRVPLDPAETPRVTAARLAKRCHLDADSQAGATRLGLAEERARYARTPTPPDGLLEALRSVRRAVALTATRGTRLRATLLPPSTLQRWRSAVIDAATGAAEVTNRWAELISRLSPRRLLRSSQQQ